MSNSVVILMALHSLVLLSSYCQGRQHFLGQLPPSRCAQILSLIRLAILLCFAIAKNGDRHQNVCVCAGTTEEAGTIQWRPEGKKRPHWGGKQEELQLGDRSKSAQTHLMPFFFCWAFFELWACLCVCRARAYHCKNNLTSPWYAAVRCWWGKEQAATVALSS